MFFVILRDYEAREEVKKRFISEAHLEGLEKAMRQSKVMVSFRAAGPDTLEKLKYRAAAKPHCVLAKTIKANEIGLPLYYSKRTMEKLLQTNQFRNNINIVAQKFLCGLVGVSDTVTNQVTGVYLSKVGEQIIGGSFSEVMKYDKAGRVYVDCQDTTTLVLFIVDVINSMKAENVLELSKFFMAGDYDMHSIHSAQEDNRFANVASDSDDEIIIIHRLQDGCLGSDRADIGVGTENDDIMPIQHGAQDNYLTHMFNKERSTTLVTKVLLPDTDVAIYAPDDNGNIESDKWSWTIINNSIAGNNYYHEALALGKQIEDLEKFYATRKAQLVGHWANDIDVQDFLIGIYDKSPEEIEKLLR